MLTWYEWVLWRAITLTVIPLDGMIPLHTDVIRVDGMESTPLIVTPLDYMIPLYADVVRVEGMQSTTVICDTVELCDIRCMLRWCGWMTWTVLPLTAARSMASCS